MSEVEQVAEVAAVVAETPKRKRGRPAKVKPVVVNNPETIAEGSVASPVVEAAKSVAKKATKTHKAVKKANKKAAKKAARKITKIGKKLSGKTRGRKPSLTTRIKKFFQGLRG